MSALRSGSKQITLTVEELKTARYKLWGTTGERPSAGASAAETQKGGRPRRRPPDPLVVRWQSPPQGDAAGAVAVALERHLRPRKKEPR